MRSPGLPAALSESREAFLELAEPERLQLLLEFSQELPEIPEELREHPESLERVTECQSPVFIAVVLDEHDIVILHATAPREAPTTRGFASILVQGVTGMDADEVLSIPDDYPQSIGLTRAVSPLRLAGMAGMLRRVKRQVREKSGR